MTKPVPSRWIGTPAEPYWMNEAACQQLIKQEGSMSRAAAAIGVYASLLHWWADAEHRARNAKYKAIKYATDPEFRAQRNKTALECRTRRYRRDSEFRAQHNYKRLKARLRQRIAAKRIKLEELKGELEQCVASLK